MKRCVQCQNELPDTAVHCVYCGSRQPAVPAGAPGGRTVMGYPGMASDVARQSGAAGKPARPAAPPVSGFDATQPLSNEGFRGAQPGGPQAGGGQPGGAPPRQAGGQPQRGFGPPPGGQGFAPGQGPGYGPPPGPPPGYGPPPGEQGYGPRPGFGPPDFGPPPDERFGADGPPGSQPPSPEYMLPQTLPPHHGIQGPGGPGFGGPPPGYGPPPQGYGPPPGQPGYGPGPAGPQGYGPPMGYHQRPETELVSPLRPPYLASETGRRASSPMEPWAESLKTLMLVFGVLLVACFVAPWRVQPGQTTFAWTILGSDAPASFKAIPILFVATGALAVVLGALPLAALVRGFAAAGIGLAPIVYQSVAPAFDWRNLLQLVGTVTLVSGLLLRSQYTAAMVGRLMATIGAICVLLPLLIPAGDSVPLAQVFQALGQGTGQTKVAAAVALVPVVLAVLAFLVWLPPPGRAGAHILAWILIVWPLVASILLWLAGGNLGAQLKGGLDAVLYGPLAAMAWAALTGYGVATVVGKQLEHA